MVRRGQGRGGRRHGRRDSSGGEEDFRNLKIRYDASTKNLSPFGTDCPLRIVPTRVPHDANHQVNQKEHQCPQCTRISLRSFAELLTRRLCPILGYRLINRPLQNIIVGMLPTTAKRIGTSTRIVILYIICHLLYTNATRNPASIPRIKNKNTDPPISYSPPIDHIEIVIPITQKILN